MRGTAGWVTLLLCATALAGCTGGGSDASQDPRSDHPLAASTFTWTPASPRAGDAVTFRADVRTTIAGDALVSTVWDVAGIPYEGELVRHTFDAPGGHDVSLTVTTREGGSRTVTQQVPVRDASEPPATDPGTGGGETGGEGGDGGGDPGGNGTDGGPNGTDPGQPGNGTAPPPQPLFDCDGETVQEPFATHGEADTSQGKLVWAVLKTGFRFAAVLPSSSAVDLEYKVGDGSWRSTAPLLPASTQVYVIDGLPVGDVLCFRVAGGQTHAVRLANAMNARGPDGVYTLNTLSLANELPAASRIEEGTKRYGELLWDATDGHVRAGRNIILFTDIEHHNTGWASCYMGASTLLANLPGCTRYFDVIYTNDATPAGAASTYKDAIEDEDQAIWMNWIWQAAPITLDDTGNVLMHEMGHYAFGAQDLYGSATDAGDCWDAALQVSIMGGNRGATEFDDEVNRCPNEAALDGYIPTWTLMRERFPAIPDRTVIDPGPTDGGAENFVHRFTVHP